MMIAVVAQRAYAQSKDEARIADQGLGQVDRLGVELRKLGDWDEQYATIERAIDRMWEENGWQEESDQFAKSLLLKVSAIPPWEFAERSETAINEVAERYHMTGAQTAKLRSQFYLRTGKLLFKNTGLIFKQVKEISAARLSGKPFTQEQITEWVNESDAFLDQAREEFDGLVETVSRDLTPQQREILERDMESYKRRVKALNDLRDSWRRGEWNPEDWGLDNDPIQTGADPIARARLLQKIRASAKRLQKQRLAQPYFHPHDETTWERYVRRFIARYKLDEGQSDACHSILREMKARADAYRKAHRRELASIPKTALPYSQRLAPIRDMFEELKRRMDRIVTNAQRRRAEAQPTKNRS